MRVVIQRVQEASVTAAGSVTGKIGRGLLVLAGYERDDNETDVMWICEKIVKLRIFPDEKGLMNCSVSEVKGDILLVSQFTLHASTRKGNRPSFMQAAPPDKAIPLYQKTIQLLSQMIGKEVQTGIFGAHMQVHLINDGPVTIFIDSKRKE